MGGVAWTEEEDQLLKKCIQQYGEGKWHRVPILAGNDLISLHHSRMAKVPFNLLHVKPCFFN